jgi:hypothetical protein
VLPSGLHALRHLSSLGLALNYYKVWRPAQQCFDSLASTLQVRVRISRALKQGNWDLGHLVVGFMQRLGGLPSSALTAWPDSAGMLSVLPLLAVLLWNS